MATTPNYGFIMPDSTDFVTDLPADFEIFGDEVDLRVKALNPETTQGDLAYRGATANAKDRLGIGTAGQVLAVNSGATAPEWIPLPLGGGMSLITTIEADNTFATFTVSSINSAFKELVVVGTNLQSSSTDHMILFRFNGDDTVTYVARNFGFVGASGQPNNTIGDDGEIFSAMSRTTDSIIGTFANGRGSFSLNVYNLQETNAHKGFAVNSSAINNAVTRAHSCTGFWNNKTDAITSITIFAASNFENGTFKLYGVS